MKERKIKHGPILLKTKKRLRAKCVRCGAMPNDGYLKIACNIMQIHQMHIYICLYM